MTSICWQSRNHWTRLSQSKWTRWHRSGRSSVVRDRSWRSVPWDEQVCPCQNDARGVTLDIKFVIAIALTVAFSIVIDIIVSLRVLWLRHILLSSLLMFFTIAFSSARWHRHDCDPNYRHYFRGYVAYCSHRKYQCSKFYDDHLLWYDDRLCCHDWDTWNYLYYVRYCPFVTTTSYALAVTRDSVIIFADPIDISITFPMIIYFVPHRYYSTIGKVLINAVLTDLEAKDVSLTIGRVLSVNTFVDVSASLIIETLRQEQTLQYERVCNDFNFRLWRSLSISVSIVSWSFRLTLVLTS